MTFARSGPVEWWLLMRIRELTDRRRLLLPVEVIVHGINTSLRGSAGTSAMATPGQSLDAITAGTGGDSRMPTEKERRDSRMRDPPCTVRGGGRKPGRLAMPRGPGASR
jgi:hypothetical protein